MFCSGFRSFSDQDKRRTVVCPHCGKHDEYQAKLECVSKSAKFVNILHFLLRSLRLNFPRDDAYLNHDLDFFFFFREVRKSLEDPAGVSSDEKQQLLRKETELKLELDK